MKHFNFWLLVGFVLFFSLVIIHISDAQQPILSDTEITGYLTASKQLLTPGNIGAGGAINATGTVSGATGSFTSGLRVGTTSGTYYPFKLNYNNSGNGLALFTSSSSSNAASIIVQSDDFNKLYLAVWNSGHANTGKSAIVAENGDLLFYASNSLRATLSAASPEFTVVGGINADFYDLTPSFREKDGVKWKKDVRDPVTGQTIAENEKLPKSSVPVAYEYTLTKEAQMLDASYFLPTIDEGIVTKTAEQKAAEYNASLSDRPGQLSLIVDGLSDEFLRKNPDGTVKGINFVKAILAMSVEDKKEILDLKNRVAALEAQ